jgi:flagellar biosynthesis chaperone FliJ
VHVELQLAGAHVAAVEEQLTQATARSPSPAGMVSSLGAWLNCSQYAARIDDVLNAAKERARQVEQRWQEADRDRVIATTETESVRQLRSQQWAAHRQEEAHRVQQEMDEGALRRWSQDSKNRLSHDTSSSP